MLLLKLSHFFRTTSSCCSLCTPNAKARRCPSSKTSKVSYYYQRNWYYQLLVVPLENFCIYGSVGLLQKDTHLNQVIPT